MTLAAELPPSPVAAWLLAARPATLPAAVAPVMLGTALAWTDGGARPLVALAAAIGAIFIQIGTNLFNDYADFKKGADTAERLGPARASQRGWLSPKVVLRGAAVAFFFATLAGLYLLYSAGWPVVAIGVASIACGIAYTGGPFPLAYRGLGDIFVFVFFGLVAVGGTYYVQTQTLTFNVMLAAIPVGALNTAILVVNNLRDRHTDAKSNKRTWAVRFGAGFSRAEYGVLVAVAYLVPVLAVISASVPTGWLLCLASLPLAVAQLRALMTKDGPELNPELGNTARLALVHSVLLSGGVLL